MLADYGADVLKVERPDGGDDTRSWGPPWWVPADGEPMSAYFICANRGKRSVAVDLASQQGADQVREWARQADVLIENFKVGQLARYGLDAAQLCELNPRLIYCSITGYGQFGPLSDQAGYDFAIQAEAGLMSLTGTPHGEPQKVGVAVADLMTGVYACSAILAALHQRERTGQGCVLDASLFDVQLAMLANQASSALVSDANPPRLGNAHPSIVPYQVFATRDSHLVLAVGNDGQFARACRVMGQPLWAEDQRFSSNPSRVAHRAELIPLLAERLAQNDTAEWVQAFSSQAVPCAPILDVRQALNHPHTLARGMLLNPHPAGSDSRPPMLAQPVLMDGQRLAAALPPPRLGTGAPIWQARPFAS